MLRCESVKAQCALIRGGVQILVPLGVFGVLGEKHLSIGGSAVVCMTTSKPLRGKLGNKLVLQSRAMSTEPC